MDLARLTGALPRRTRLLRRVRLWARRISLGIKLEIALAIFAVASGVATYIALSNKGAQVDPGKGAVASLLLLDLILLVTLAALVGRRLLRVWLARREGSAGSKLHLRMAGLFALVAAVPPIIMAVLSVLFLQYGVSTWFSDSVRSAINNSLDVAEAYIEEHRKNIRLDLIAMASDINRAAARAEQNRAYLQDLLEEQALVRALQEAIVFDSTGMVLAKFSLNLDLSVAGFSDPLIQRVKEGELVVTSDPGDDQVRAMTRLDEFFDGYLYIARNVDPLVTEYVEATRRAAQSYRTLEDQRSMIQLRANGIFIVIALLVLFAAMWIGLWFANRLVTPIGRLVEAADRVREGDLSARAEGPQGPDEIGVLSRTFNRMTRQLQAQRRELVSTNRELDERRRFLETVLEGVSAGVLGVTASGKIHVPNRSACDLLGRPADELIGADLEAVAPEMAPLLHQAAAARHKTAQGQIGHMRGEQQRTLLVRVAAEEQLGGHKDIPAGFVVTFDDITAQLRDQRTAAWADVARRIAHEIKNPLTPIQLSAERLKRKYSREVQTDPGVFSQCTDTIIRQVADLRRMVDEFSSFARMPSPRFKQETLRDIVRQTVFLQQMADSPVRFSAHVPDDPVDLVCDGRLLAQALTNLMKNAAESVAQRQEEDPDAPAGQVDVSLRAEADLVEIVVTDNGRGLPEDADRLTEPYVTTRAKGTGLGLAIVKKVAEEHSGGLFLSNLADANGERGARVSLRFSRMQLENKLEKSQETAEALGPRAAE